LSAGVLAPVILWAAESNPNGPSFDCSKVQPKSLEELICKTPELARQDREMANLYQELIASASEDEKTKYRARQREWLKERQNYFDSGYYISAIYRLYTGRIIDLIELLPETAYGTGTSRLKDYHNDAYSFEFNYPGYMRIVESSPTLKAQRGLPSHSEPTEVVKIVYALNGDIRGPYFDKNIVFSNITFESGLAENACIPAPSNSGSTKHKDVLNGFYVDGRTGEPRGASWQDFKTYHNGNCVTISRVIWDRGPSKDIEHDRVVLEKHFKAMKEIVRSFRFLDK